MTGDQKKNLRKEDRLEKAKGRLQQSFPEIQQRIRRSSAVEIAQSIFRQFADDIQLKDLLAKAEAFVVAKVVPKDAPLTARFRDATPSNESLKNAGEKKTPSKRAHLKKVPPKKTLSKKKKKPAPKRSVKTR